MPGKRLAQRTGHIFLARLTLILPPKNIYHTMGIYYSTVLSLKGLSPYTRAQFKRGNNPFFSAALCTTSLTLRIPFQDFTFVGRQNTFGVRFRLRLRRMYVHRGTYTVIPSEQGERGALATVVRKHRSSLCTSLWSGGHDARH